MTRRHKRSRPQADPGAAKAFGGATEHSTVERLDTLARARRHDYGILVTSVRRDGVAVQQVYTNLPAAERKQARCAERGLPCSLTLVRLTPVHSTIDPADVLGGEAL